jgi:UDP:flavonoid glycosyltransferase YjiC (YdhE family)
VDVLLLPLGSAGDVLPFCGLARALAARGHRVTVAANPHFAALVARAGLDFLPLGDERAFLRLVESPKLMHPARGFHRLMRWVCTLVQPTFELISLLRPDVVVAHPLAFGARVAEEALGVRTATVLLSPAILQSEHQPPELPGLVNGAAFPRWYKRSVWWAADRLIIDPTVAPTVNKLRAKLGLPPVRRLFRQGWGRDHLFVALFPEWFAPRQPDWPRRLELTGFPLHDDDDGAPAREVAQFLVAGEAPVVFVPGTGQRHAGDFLAAAADACARLGRRGLLLTRFVDQVPPSLPEGVKHFSYVPLSRLLPHACALVHHGGIGTSAAALQAGIPQLVIPGSHDQPDNAARLERLGVAARLSERRLSGPAMAKQLGKLLGSLEVAAHCAAAAERIRDTTPLDDAAKAIERYAVVRMAGEASA